jgi:hypothetical protein
MNEKTGKALVPRPPSGVEKAAPGVKRILSGIVADTLALASREQRAPEPKRFRIGEYEWCEPDYRQILIWAEETGLKPEEVILRLLNQQSLCKDVFGQPGTEPFFDEPLYSDGGRLLKVNFDLGLFRCGKLEWMNGLAITHLRFIGASDAAWLSDLGALPLVRLRYLSCRRLGLTHLNLTRVPRLKILACSDNRLEKLQLDCSPQLTHLFCGKNILAELRVDQIPELRSLDCRANRLAQLDLSGLYRLYATRCGDNKLTELKLAGLPNLELLSCQENCLCDLDLAEVLGLCMLDCSSNQIFELVGLGQLTSLRYLECSRNRLTWLDFSSMQELEYLGCAGNAISELDLNSCPNLIELDCANNPISVLDIRELKHLQRLSRSPHTKVIMDSEQKHTVQEFLSLSTPKKESTDLWKRLEEALLLRRLKHLVRMKLDLQTLQKRNSTVD